MRDRERGGLSRQMGERLRKGKKRERKKGKNFEKLSVRREKKGGSWCQKGRGCRGIQGDEGGYVGRERGREEGREKFGAIY